jgi:hypothetical protein
VTELPDGTTDWADALCTVCTVEDFVAFDLVVVTVAGADGADGVVRALQAHEADLTVPIAVAPAGRSPLALAHRLAADGMTTGLVYWCERLGHADDVLGRHTTALLHHPSVQPDLYTDTDMFLPVTLAYQ